jgi:hypothetical protein
VHGSDKTQNKWKRGCEKNRFHVLLTKKGQACGYNIILPLLFRKDRVRLFSEKQHISFKTENVFAMNNIE